MSLSLHRADTPVRRPAVVTIEMRGAISRLAAARVTRAIRSLPDDVRAAHLDLSRVRLYDVAAVDGVIDALRAWARDHAGILSITAPLSGRGP